MNDINIYNATKSFQSTVLYSDLSMTIPGGKITALTGASGSGKSTLLNCVGLLDEFDSGEIWVGDRKISGCSPKDQRIFRRDALGYMFQNYALIESATVQENLEVAMAAKGKSALKSANFDGALERVGLADKQKAMVYSLSGGEQQRVALARLILKRPMVVLADEPTGALDPENEAMVLKELRSIANEGAAVLIATHSTEVMTYCDLALEIVRQ